MYKNNLYKTVYKTSNDRKMLLVFIGGSVLAVLTSEVTRQLEDVLALLLCDGENDVSLLVVDELLIS